MSKRHIPGCDTWRIICSCPTQADDPFDALMWRQAYVARAGSTDRSTHVGVVIVSPRWQQVSVFGTNQFPKGVLNKEERHARPAKYQFTEHAERNAIYAAARQGVGIAGHTIYIASDVPGFPPCCDCARAIIQSGIVRIVGKTGDNDPALWRADWKDSMVAAAEMLAEAGVKFDTIDVSEIV